MLLRSKTTSEPLKVKSVHFNNQTNSTVVRPLVLCWLSIYNVQNSKVWKGRFQCGSQCVSGKYSQYTGLSEHCPWLVFQPELDSFLHHTVPNIQTMIISCLHSSMFLFSGPAEFCLTLSELHRHYKQLMAMAKRRCTSLITSIDPFVKMDLSVTERSVQANVQTCALRE